MLSAEQQKYIQENLKPYHEGFNFQLSNVQGFCIVSIPIAKLYYLRYTNDLKIYCSNMRGRILTNCNTVPKGIKAAIKKYPNADIGITYFADSRRAFNSVLREYMFITGWKNALSPRGTAETEFKNLALVRYSYGLQNVVSCNPNETDNEILARSRRGLSILVRNRFRSNSRLAIRAKNQFNANDPTTLLQALRASEINITSTEVPLGKVPAIVSAFNSDNLIRWASVPYHLWNIDSRVDNLGAYIEKFTKSKTKEGV